jgi:hypothetical protein
MNLLTGVFTQNPVNALCKRARLCNGAVNCGTEEGLGKSAKERHRYLEGKIPVDGNDLSLKEATEFPHPAFPCSGRDRLVHDNTEGCSVRRLTIAVSDEKKAKKKAACKPETPNQALKMVDDFIANDYLSRQLLPDRKTAAIRI